MNRQTQRHIKRMQNVVRALEEAPEPDRFTMAYFGHRCGTPACAFGHYAARTDLQKTYRMDKRGQILMNSGVEMGGWSTSLCPHFGISYQEADDLFEVNGCNFAQDNRQRAIAFIKKFIIKKWGVISV